MTTQYVHYRRVTNARDRRDDTKQSRHGNSQANSKPTRGAVREVATSQIAD